MRCGSTRPPCPRIALAGKRLYVAGAGHFVSPSFKYRDGGSSGVFANPGTGDGGDGGDLAFIPQLFLVGSIGGGLWMGVAQNGPFGLKTEYDYGWRGRFVALKSQSRAVNLNPALAYEVSPGFSVGLGVNFQRFKVQLVRDAGPAGISDIDAGDSTIGWNAGIMLKPGAKTRVGLSYRSRMEYELGGTATFTGNPLANRSVNAAITLPESASFSVVTELTKQWEIMADATWTRWSRLQTINVVPTTPLLGPQAALLPPLVFNWDNSMRVGIVLSYQPNETWKFRTGIAYDPTPTKDATRTPQLPDQDRTFVSVGARYDTKTLGRIDVSFMHQFIRDARVNVSSPASTLSGTFKNRADILSIQHSIAF